MEGRRGVSRNAPSSLPVYKEQNCHPERSEGSQVLMSRKNVQIVDTK
jgi:hypothetical protein